MKLYGYWRSLATYRVRIALNLKRIGVPETLIDFETDEQNSATFRAVNPMGAVPALVLDDGTVLTQSLAILEYLDETCPEPPLLPKAAAARARARALCALTAADTHPLVVPRIQGYLTREWGIDEPRRIAWNAHWFRRGLDAYETLLAGAGPFCSGESPGMADACLASHVAGAQRFGVELAPYPAVTAIHGRCIALPEFARAHPLRQPGAPA